MKRDRPRVRGKDSATCNWQAKTSWPDTDTYAQATDTDAFGELQVVGVTVAASGTLVTT